MPMIDAVFGKGKAGKLRSGSSAWLDFAKKHVPAIATPKSTYGKRPDGTEKGDGWLGPIRFTKPDGSTGVMTEYSVGTNIDGKEMDIPTLVPTLSPEEIELMKTDIVPNGKKVPDAIFRKALDHAMKQLNAGKSVWATERK